MNHMYERQLRFYLRLGYPVAVTARGEGFVDIVLREQFGAGDARFCNHRLLGPKRLGRRRRVERATRF